MLKILELFSGIGAYSKALSNLGIAHEIVDAVDIDQYAINSFNEIHGTNFGPQDITKWDKDIECDLICHGSPCQDFSLAGLGAGGDKGSGTRSSLMYETLRIVDKIRPKYVVWENVKGVLSKKHRHNFDAYIQKMQSLGYNSYYQILNAKDYGLPQNRERVFTVSIRNDGGFDSYFIFPSENAIKKSWRDLLDEKVDDKFYLTPSHYSKVKFKEVDKEQKNRPVRVGGLYDKYGDKFESHQAGSIYDLSGIAPTLSTMQGGNREPIIVESWDPLKIRKCTPRECWRLMGFTDDDFNKVKDKNSNSQLYKQAGNSICVPVLEAVFRELFSGEVSRK